MGSHLCPLPDAELVWPVHPQTDSVWEGRIRQPPHLCPPRARCTGQWSLWLQAWLSPWGGQGLGSPCEALHGSSLAAEEWIPANKEPVERCGFTVKDLPTGAKILFRVVGVNIAGRSEPATLAQPVTIREIVGEGPPTAAWSLDVPRVSPARCKAPPCVFPQSSPRSACPATSVRPTSAKWGSTSTWSSPSRWALGPGVGAAPLRRLDPP